MKVMVIIKASKAEAGENLDLAGVDFRIECEDWNDRNAEPSEDSFGHGFGVVSAKPAFDLLSGAQPCSRSTSASSLMPAGRVQARTTCDNGFVIGVAGYTISS